MTRATHKADDMFAANGITSWILGRGQIYGRHAKNDCQAPRRPLDQDRLQLEPSSINQAKRVLFHQPILTHTKKMFWPLIKSGVTCFPTPRKLPTQFINSGVTSCPTPKTVWPIW